MLSVFLFLLLFDIININNREVVRVNRKGQALVEFVLILPVFLLILLVVVDFGHILYSKNKLENDSTDMVRILKNESSIEFKQEYPDIDLDIKDYEEGYKKIVFSKYIDINTPFLDRVLGDPCLIKTERVIPYE